MDDKQYFAIYGVLKAVHTGEIEPDIAADVIVSGLSHAEGEAVGEITIDKHGDAHFRASQGYLDLDQGTYDLYTHPAPQVAVPEGWRHALEEALAMMTSQSMTLERQADAVTGIRDLLAAPTAPAVVWVQPPFSYEEYEQANGRVIRNGRVEAFCGDPASPTVWESSRENRQGNLRRAIVRAAAAMAEGGEQ